MTWPLLAAAFILGVFGLAIFAAVREFGSWIRADRERHQRELARLHAENAKLLATALDAKGIAYIDPAAPQRIASPPQASLIRRVEGGLSRLAREDEQRAVERDARVAAEMEEANRVARERRGELWTAAGRERELRGDA